MAKFTDIFEDVTKQGTKIPTNLYLETGMYPIIDQGQSQVAGYTNETEGLFTDIPAIIFGDHTRIIKYVDTPCFLGADGVKLLKAKDPTANYKYLYYALCNADIPNTGYNRHFKWLKEIEIAECSTEEQNSIVAQFEKIDTLICLRKQQLSKLDELVKSRFIELFENGESPIKTVEELCSDIVDCPHITPKYEGELKNPAIRTSEIKKGYIAWETMRYVSDEEYEERTARLKPEAGDIVYGREGTFGNAAILPGGYNFCLGQRVMLLRPDYSKCTSEYLLHSVISDDVYRQATEKNNASTVAHVNVKDVKQFKVPLLSFDKQIQFATFVEQTDKSKLEIQKSLEKLETLKKALMQKYFR